MSQFVYKAVIAATAAALLVSSASPALADDGDGDTLGALQDVTAASASPVTDVLDNVAQVPTTESGPTAIQATLGSVQVTVPTDPEQPIALRSTETGKSVGVTLPFSGSADSANREAAGVVSYDNNNGSTTAPVVKTDGSVQITTVIADASAPTDYAYTIAAPPGGALVKDDSGAVIVTDASDQFVAALVAPWAKDADGQDIATSFTVSGNTVTQHIAHTAQGTAYPVVADPFLGAQLLAGVWKNRPGGYRYLNGDQWSTMLSGYGALLWVQGVAGNTIIQNYGWKEYLSRGGYNSESVHEQYNCHAMFGYAIWKAGVHWDFETARQPHYNWMFDPQGCNWK